ncbi:MAG: aminotransferase class V-fold PLP-dependent enzyme [Proteobacteria bacterium]|nr:MAG: aminotransferase class V-fold PLP-dependent enzyme [Pseudomonadota bacterium]
MNFRDSFHTDPGLTHLNNAGLSPINIEAEAAVKYWVERYRREGMFCNDAYLEGVDQARLRLANFLDATPGSIAFFQSTANAVSQLAFHVNLKPGDEVVMWDQEYGSHLYPWQEACKRTGATLILVESEDEMATPTEKLLRYVTDKTKVIAVSWVQFQTGALSDLDQLVARAKKNNIWTVVDGFQGIGVLPFSFKTFGIDAVVGGSHKWMTSPVGVGYLCIKEERVKELSPHNIGAYTYGTCEDPTDLACTPKRDALRFEAGSKQVLEIIALGASADLIRRCGLEQISKTAIGLAQSLADGLKNLDYHIVSSNGSKQKTPIVNIVPTDKSPFKTIDDVINRLVSNKVSYARRGPGIRLAAHAHNEPADIERALKLFRKD